MTDLHRQTLARMHLLAWIVQVDGAVQPWERTLLEQALMAAGVQDAVSLDGLLSEPMPPEAALAAITEPDAQQQAYAEALAFAQVDGLTPAEQDALQHIRQAFALPESEPVPVLAPAVDWDSPTLSGRGVVLGMRWLINHSEKMRDRILDYALGAALFGLIPFPVPFLKPLLLVALLLWMRRDIKRHWGAPRRKDMLALAGLSVGCFGVLMLGLLTWMMVWLISLQVVLLRSFALAIAYFTLTWSLGQITNQFYLSGSRLDIESLRQVTDSGAGDRPRLPQSWLKPFRFRKIR